MRSALLEIQRTYPHSSPVLLSALAEGADRLAGRVALQLGMRLVAVLPFPQAEYERDFDPAASLEEFRDLLTRAAGVLALPFLDGASPGDIERQGPARDREYAKAGAYIAAHSQIFFAFWDGSPDTGDKVGGTAQTVGFRLEGAQAPYVGRRSGRVFGVTAGPVHHVRTPRVTNPASASLPCDVVRISPTNLPDGSFDRICDRIETFNRDSHRFDRVLAASSAASTAGLLNVDAASVTPTISRLSSTCREIVDQYVAADTLALQFRGRVLTTWVRVYIGVAIAALMFNMHSSFYSVPDGPMSLSAALASLPWFFIASLACSMLTATYVYGRAQKGEYHTKYLDYRALAEALRIQFFWKVAGITDPVVDWYLRKQRSDLEWIRSALRSFDVMTAAAEQRREPMALSLAERLTLVLSWIEDQRRYYATKARAEKAKLEHERVIVARLLKVSGLLSLILATILIVPTLASGIVAAEIARLTPTPLQHGAWMVVIPMFAVSAGLLHGYGQQLARAEHARQFQRMSELFYAAETDLRKAAGDGGDNAAAMVRELGIEALDENGDWLILHRERPLEVPPG
jgi:hypothetical protein